MRDEFDRDFQASLQGRAPQMNVKIPEHLTRDKVLELENKLSKSIYPIISEKYLIQVDRYRMIKGKSQEELMANPEIFKGIKSPE